MTLSTKSFSTSIKMFESSKRFEVYRNLKSVVETDLDGVKNLDMVEEIQEINSKINFGELIIDGGRFLLKSMNYINVGKLLLSRIDCIFGKGYYIGIHDTMKRSFSIVLSFNYSLHKYIICNECDVKEYSTEENSVRMLFLKFGVKVDDEIEIYNYQENYDKYILNMFSKMDNKIINYYHLQKNESILCVYNEGLKNIKLIFKLSSQNDKDRVLVSSNYSIIYIRQEPNLKQQKTKDNNNFNRKINILGYDFDTQNGIVSGSGIRRDIIRSIRSRYRFETYFDDLLVNREEEPDV